MLKNISTTTRVALFIIILASILTTYYSKVVLEDFDILFTESGIPDLEV